MGNDIVEIRAQVTDLIRANRAILAAVTGQLRSGNLDKMSDARWLLERLAKMLDTHIDELSEHLGRLGAGSVAPTYSRDALAGDLMKAAAQSLQLETTARARGYSSTAAMATRHREEIATILSGIREVLPPAIKEEIGGGVHVAS
jgi:hypothetical protein